MNTATYAGWYGQYMPHERIPLHFLLASQSTSLSSNQYLSTSTPILSGNEASWNCISFCITFSSPLPLAPSLPFVPSRMLGSTIVEYLLFSLPFISLETSFLSFFCLIFSTFGVWLHLPSGYLSPFLAFFVRTSLLSLPVLLCQPFFLSFWLWFRCLWTHWIWNWTV